MRTTVTLDPDTEQLIRRRMKDRGISFKAALNEAVREGITGTRRSGQFRTPSHDMGIPSINLDRALQLADELEDDELVRKQRLGK